MWGLTLTDLRQLAAIDSSKPPPPPPLPEIRRSEDDVTWLRDFNQWAEASPNPVDSLNSKDLYLVIHAASELNIDRRLKMLNDMYKFADSNEGTLEGLSDLINVLELEIGHIMEHIGKSISEFALTSPRLVDEYVNLQRHARNTTGSESRLSAIMTWYHGWPPGFALLLRILAVHTRRVENLKINRDSISSGRLDFEQFSKSWSAIAYDDGIYPYGYGYERNPMRNGLADFRAPPMTSINSDKSFQNVRSSAFIRSERRRAALHRLFTCKAGVSDFLAPNYVDIWYHQFSKWLNHLLPRLRELDPQCADKWANVGNYLEEMHHQWTAEAAYASSRVLTTKYAQFWLETSPKMSIHRENGQFRVPIRHKPFTIQT
jgi:hypothetical protein